MFNFNESKADQEESINKSIELLSTENIKEIWQHKRQTMLKDQIDYTAFLSWFLENYPESHIIMRENPDYQNKYTPGQDSTLFHHNLEQRK